ncbi:MAG TPA: hypothetical protein ENJ19_04690 [Gammaproteobacteria bacterium]|nr:hypothetical protein [Gammaproteobacteria bacterium]
MTVYKVDKLMSEARRLARDYRSAMGKPLAGISAELAVHDAIRLLDLRPAPAGTVGYDALGQGRWDGKRIQIKGRAIFDEGRGGQRIGQLKTEQDWDSVVLVLMDEAYEPFEIYEAERDEVMAAVAESAGSKRSRRGALSVAKFKIISRLVWTRENGIEDEIWDNQGRA